MFETFKHENGNYTVQALTPNSTQISIIQLKKRAKTIHLNMIENRFGIVRITLQINDRGLFKIPLTPFLNKEH